MTPPSSTVPIWPDGNAELETVAEVTGTAVGRKIVGFGIMVADVAAVVGLGEIKVAADGRTAAGEGANEGSGWLRPEGGSVCTGVGKCSGCDALEGTVDVGAGTGKGEVVSDEVNVVVQPSRIRARANRPTDSL
jgi:hypothetical protein